jgi:hypothetical protein
MVGDYDPHDVRDETKTTVTYLKPPTRGVVFPEARDRLKGLQFLSLSKHRNVKNQQQSLTCFKAF